MPETQPGLPVAEVREIFGCEPERLKVESLYPPVASATRGVWRVVGPTRTAILKELVANIDAGDPAWRASGDPTHPYYWRREADAYASGLLLDLPPGVRAPTCYAVHERDDGVTAIWLEEVDGASPASWGLDDYVRVARMLGRAQGRLSGAADLTAAWLSHDWLRAYVSRHEQDVELLGDPRPRRHPLVRRHVSPGSIGAVTRLWEEKDELAAWLDAIPATVCHFDFSPSNVLLLEDDVVIIDWAFVGVGPLGADAGAFAPNAAFDYRIEPAELEALTPSLTQAYLQGLQEGGWAGEVRLPELGFAAGAALKFAWTLPAVLRAAITPPPDFNGRPVAFGMERWVELTGHVIASAARARELAAGLLR